DEQKDWQPIDLNNYYCGTSSAYTMKGKEGYDAILKMKGEGFVSNVSMADAFIELLTEKPEILNHAGTQPQHHYQ
nr:bifunctional metallophosphatase/5'-nucleotidase [Vibrio anguillarum]